MKRTTCSSRVLLCQEARLWNSCGSSRASQVAWTTKRRNGNADFTETLAPGDENSWHVLGQSWMDRN